VSISPSRSAKLVEPNGPGTRVSAIVPALDEASGIAATLASLTPLIEAGHELLVVDGGSRDATAAVARDCGAQVVTAAAGRANQMNAGAAVAGGDLLWFVHADTRVAAPALAWLTAAAATPSVVWGRVAVRLDSERPLLRLVGWSMNLRSRLTAVATGDQGVFVRRDLFQRVGGFPEQPLMEDVALCKRLRRHARPLCLPVGLTTSARRWQDSGVWRTILLMWRLRFAYWRGADPARLAARYRQGRAA